LNLIPYHSETLVSALSKKMVLSKLDKVTVEVNYLDRRSQQDRSAFFNGIIRQNGFRISKIIDRGDTFLPLLLGTIEETPRGCILFLRYRLFPGALFFLGFWSVILLATAAFYVWVTPNYLYATIAVTLTILNYLIAILLFNRQVKNSRGIFYNLLNFQIKD
jgi:hypothetical protein